MKIVDKKSWPRKDSFDFFNSYEFPQFNIVAEVDITSAYSFFEEKKISKFNGMLWYICQAANAVRELRYRISDDKVVEHHQVHPSFTWLNEDNSLTFCNAKFSDNIADFFKSVEDSIAGVERDLSVADEQCNDGVIYVSCLPWINFTSISHPLREDDTVSIPRISWGKFTKKGDGWSMPVSIQIHHGLGDGYHTALFFKELQQNLDRPDNFIWP